MNEVTFAEPRAAALPPRQAAAPRGARRDLAQAAESVLEHSDFIDVLQLSRRGGLALIRHEGALRVFKFISCQADWKKRWARRAGWNPARRAHRMSSALSAHDFKVCEVEDYGRVSLEQAPRAVWTISRYVENGRTLRQLKEDLQPGRIAPTHPVVWEVFEGAMRLLRRIHDAGFEHRDYHAGNLLVTPRGGDVIEPGNSDLHLVDLETIMKRRATIRRRARDISRFLENFIESGNLETIISRAMQQYAPDDPQLARRVSGTRRMRVSLVKKAARKNARRRMSRQG